MSASAASLAAARNVRRRVLKQMALGVGATAVPVTAWWYWARQQRHEVQELARTAVKLPPGVGVGDTYDFLISDKCRPGDVILMDRRWERCAASPWSALACFVSKKLLCNDHDKIRTVDEGFYDHVGLIVPGYATTAVEKYDPTNLLLLEATPSGVVARPLKQRLEQSSSHTILLLQLMCPGEQRNVIGAEDERDEKDEKELTPVEKSVLRTRKHVDKQLTSFRNTWLAAAEKQGYKYVHSTVTLGGAIAYRLGLSSYLSGPVSPSAYLVLCGLQNAAAAPSITDKENLACKTEDYLRDYRFTEKDAVRLRPGWRFLAPITLKQGASM